MTRGLRAAQGDGRKPVPHIITGLVAVALSLGVPYLTHFDAGARGPAGPAGTSSTHSGVCAYFGPDAQGTRRFQISTPQAGGSCTHGTFVSVEPGK